MRLFRIFSTSGKKYEHQFIEKEVFYDENMDTEYNILRLPSVEDIASLAKDLGSPLIFFDDGWVEVYDGYRE